MGNTSSSSSSKKMRLNIETGLPIYENGAEHPDKLNRSVSAVQPATNNSLAVSPSTRTRHTRSMIAPSKTSARVSRSVSTGGASTSRVDAAPPPYSPAVPDKVVEESGMDALADIRANRRASPSAWGARGQQQQHHSGGAGSSSSGNTRSNAVGADGRRNAFRSNTYLRQPLRQGTEEDVLEVLRKYDTVIIVDDSGSMAGSLWREAKDALCSLAEKAANYDVDGVDLYFINDKRVGTNMTNTAEVEALFKKVRPMGSTPLGQRLEDLLLEYLDTLERAKNDKTNPQAWKEIKPINFVVITDGAPTDDPESVIISAARRLDQGNFPLSQVGIQFVQIGKDPEATDFLNELDDGLQSKHNIRDIVDTTPYIGAAVTGDMIIKVLIGGINRRVDNRGWTG